MTNRRGQRWVGGRPAGIAGLVLAAIAGSIVSAPRPCRGGEPPAVAGAGDRADGAERRPSSRGRALFVGAESLTAKIRGHQSSLPPEVVRCETCHGDRVRPAATNQGAPPHLDRSLLLRPQARRGGPPSSYDLASFCRMLRTGADPAYVLIAREMPTYDIDDGACAALWGFLTAAPESAGAPTGTDVRRGRAATKTGARAEGKTRDASR